MSVDQHALGTLAWNEAVRQLGVTINVLLDLRKRGIFLLTTATAAMGVLGAFALKEGLPTGDATALTWAAAIMYLMCVVASIESALPQEAVLNRGLSPSEIPLLGTDEYAYDSDEEVLAALARRYEIDADANEDAAKRIRVSLRCAGGALAFQLGLLLWLTAETAT